MVGVGKQTVLRGGCCGVFQSGLAVRSLQGRIIICPCTRRIPNILCCTILAAIVHRQRLGRAHGVRHRGGEAEEIAPALVGVPMYIIVYVVSEAVQSGGLHLFGFPCWELARAAAVNQEDRRGAVLHGGGVQKDKRVVSVGTARHLHHAAPDDLVGFAALRVDFRNSGQDAVHAEDDEIAVGNECGVVLVVSRL